jgi:hypothetical protein
MNLFFEKKKHFTNVKTDPRFQHFRNAQDWSKNLMLYTPELGVLTFWNLQLRVSVSVGIWKSVTDISQKSKTWFWPLIGGFKKS